MKRLIDSVLHPSPPYSWILAVVMAVLFAQLISAIPSIDAFDSRVRDASLSSAAPLPTHDDIVVIGLNDEALAQYSVYRTPLHRGLLADILERLIEAEARAVGFDVLFVDPTEPEHDDRLRELLVSAPMSVIVATANETNAFDEQQLAFQNEFTQGVATGHASVLTDNVDGRIRTQLPLPNGPSGDPTFPGRIAKELGYQLPEGEFLIDYQRGSEEGLLRFPVYPALQALTMPIQFLRDKIVLVGWMMPDDRDDHPTPMDVNGEETLGVLIQAEKLSQLLEGRQVPTVGNLSRWLICAAAALMGLGLALVPISMFFKLVMAIAGVVGWLVFVIILGQKGGAMLPFVAPALAWPISIGFVETFEGSRARRERQQIRDAFQHFVSPAIVKNLLDDPEKLTLHGEEREISTIFTDLQGFTALTLEVEPRLMVQLLNGYLDNMLDTVIERGGTVDKVIGDAVHACFGAPTDQPEHAQMALDCALELDRVCRNYQEEVMRDHGDLLRAKGVRWGETRIGLHTGRAIVGNFGSEQRFDYTAHGDSVNTAARFEGANKTLGTRICVSRATIEQCTKATARRIGMLKVAGRTSYIEALEPVLEMDDYMTRYEAAVDRMSENDMDAARSILRTLAEERSNDRLVRFHLERIENGASGLLIEIDKK